ncbi:hypothetical protein COW99_05115 [Candidatus Roizmanbacteria bacterium CG22_combo_CG10-13_8_21_14_all_38_20]|uniref:Uncharacterized protein n=1 Tax=Candidatus Roizmanbacteria bacterium CG22_combo_CG10-13_8_21_14_all_38_20 TaxID=1974862 RepID=A0A2H0BU57_9BACT|nr:hypothetical protein [Candidatus Microgenomates bacterium]PIP61144.1 MAG: hypothetical protein COW99_05115 [Candidatus Roizmanbacteria bacterium CG22_combo_CG10-13_8_21_14_all_38_20]PJC31134.1 MAG: hypothetical protein CO050_03780 [Candidatus Roizmanbacteria bacterium CG_4_9_14_0_2_um_filter_38_17]
MFEAIKAFFVSVLLLVGAPVGIPAQDAIPVQMPNEIVNEVTITPPSDIYDPNSTNKPLPTATVNKSVNKVDPNPRSVNEDKIQFITPEANKAYTADKTIKVEVKVVGEVQKLEIYAASGVLAGTLYARPFVLDLQLSKYVSGINDNYRLPLEAKAYRKDGSVFRAGMTVNVAPIGHDTSFGAPEMETNVSYKDITFVKDSNSSRSGAGAKGNFVIEQYDPFANTTSVKTKGSAWGLEPNSKYDVFVITKQRSISIGSLNTDGNGSGEFFTGLFTDQNYCDIYTMGIKKLGVEDNQSDLWANQLVDSCPKG